MHLDDISKDEAAILVGLLAILKQLPEDMKEYTPAIGELSTYFQGKGHKRGETNLPRKRQIRARARYGS